MFSKEVKEICQDVISRVKSGRLVPNCGSLISDDTRDLLTNYPELSGKEAINTNVCSVCAKGALFLSWVGTNNKYSLKDILYFNYNLSQKRYPKEVIDIFGEILLDCIELAFELNSNSWTDISLKNQRDLINYYSKQYNQDSKARLLEIMQDIIDDKFVWCNNVSA